MPTRLGMASVTTSSTPHIAIAAATNGFLMAGTGTSAPSSTETQGATSAAQQWAPNPNAVDTLVNLLKLSTTAESAVQGRLFTELQSYASERDFNNYLAYILANPNATASILQLDQSSHQVIATRQAAGLLLKSNVRVMYMSLHPHVQAYVSAQLVNAIGDNSEPIRDVVASCISTLVLHNRHLVAFSGLITSLMLSLDSARPTYLDGSLTVISRLAEDAPNVLAEDVSRPLEIMLPKIIRLCRHQSQSVRVRSLQILNHFILVMPPALQANVDVLCSTLFSIAEDSSAQVRKRVCTAICLLLSTAPNALAPHINSVIEYMLLSSTHPDEAVAKEASEFWGLCADRKGLMPALRPFLPRLVPVLLENIVYSTQDRAGFDAVDGPDDMVPDRAEDIRPRFYQGKLRGVGSSGNDSYEDHVGGQEFEKSHDLNADRHLANGANIPNGASNSHQYSNGYHGDTDEDEGDTDEEDDSNVIGEEGQWNLRRTSAAALDKLSAMFNEEVLDILLPRLHEKLFDLSRWEQRECGVLALGAIAEGCAAGMARHMDSLFPYLLQSAGDQHYMVRCISCWTLSRYAKWVVKGRPDNAYQELLKVLLERMLDRYKVVQKASCSALASLAEESGSLLSTYLSPVLRSVAHAFERYQKSNLFGLYDVVCALADAVGSELAVLEHMNVLMPILMSQWNTVADTDPIMLPLLECLSLVFRAIGAPSQQFAGPIFSRCANIMDVVYSKESKGEQDDLHVELLAYTLDLMCGLAEAVGAGIDPFVATSTNGSKPVMPFLFVAMCDSRQEVRQSSFALLGEFARVRLPALIPSLPEYVRYAVEALNPDYLSVSNNATWALGELIMMAGFLPASVPFDREAVQRTLLEGAAEPLIQMVNSTQLNRTLLENAAITLGRLGLVLPEPMATKLASFAKPIFMLLRNIRDDADKEQAFHGINSMVRINPGAILDCFVYFVDAIASWYHCKPDLEMEFANILNGYKTTLDDRWIPMFNSFTPELQRLLKDRFGL